MSNRYPYSRLRPIQLKLIDLVIRHKSMLLALQMGFGKTVIALTVIRYFLDTFQIQYALVVAPKLVAEETWPQEIEDWEHTSVLDYEVLTGPEKQRGARAKMMPEVTIINHENLPWLVQFWGDDWPYDYMVIDELSRLRNPKLKNKPSKKKISKVVDETMAGLPKGLTEQEIELAVKRAVKKVKSTPTRFAWARRARHHTDYVLGLTGTVAPTGLANLWAQVYLIDMGQRLYSAYHQFRNVWFQSDYGGWNYEPRPGAFEQIMDRVRDIMVSLKTRDHVEMPEAIYERIEVELSPEVMRQYRQFEKTLMLEEHDIEAVNNGVLTQKLLQYANSSVYDEDGEVVEIHSEKLGALETLVESALEQGQPVLIAYSFEFDKDKIRKRYPHAEVAGEQKNLQKRWNAGEIPILLAHPESAGHGLNLQYGGYIIIWYGLTWSLEYYQQLNTRLERPGQENTVMIYHILAKGTVDERVMAVLPEREATQDAIFEATKLAA